MSEPRHDTACACWRCRMMVMPISRTDGREDRALAEEGVGEYIKMLGVEDSPERSDKP